MATGLVSDPSYRFFAKRRGNKVKKKKKAKKSKIECSIWFTFEEKIDNKNILLLTAKAGRKPEQLDLLKLNHTTGKRWDLTSRNELCKAIRELKQHKFVRTIQASIYYANNRYTHAYYFRTGAQDRWKCSSASNGPAKLII